MDQELYRFLKKYNLIQAQLTDEEALELIKNTIESKDDSENVVSGFIAEVVKNNSAEPQVVLLTDKNRLIFNPNSQFVINPISIEELKNVYSDENRPEREFIIRTNNDLINFQALDAEGAEAINDAVYSVAANILDEDKLEEVFDIYPEDDFEEQVVETTPVNTTVPEPVQNIVEPSVSEPIQQQPVQPAPVEPVVEATPVQNIPVAEPTPVNIQEQPQPTSEKKILGMNKPVFYIVAAVGVIILGIALYYIISNFTKNSAVNSQATNLIEIFNDTDDIYYSAVDLQNLGQGGSTPEEWSELETLSNDIQDRLINADYNSETDSLYQAIYFYNETLNTALYYGRQYAATGNQLQGNTLNARMQSAYQNRLAVIMIIEEDFPNLEDKVVNTTNLNDEDINYPNKEMIDQLEQEANSEPTDNIVQENSKSSNEALQNTINSRESTE